MTVPYFLTEDKSDMRGIKHGWYAMEDDGKLSSGPLFQSRGMPQQNHAANEQINPGAVAFTAKVATEAAEPMNTGLSEAFN